MGGQEVKFKIPESILANAGEVGILMRSLDWSATVLGSVDTWSPSLWTAASMCLTSRFPMIILWGSDLVQIYNDGYRKILGAKHPQAMGQPTRECWSEVWHINEPIYKAVFAGQVSYYEDQLYPIERNGYLEESYFTLSYSPIYEEDSVGGILVTVLETTGQVIDKRRLSTLRELSNQTALPATVQEACEVMTRTLAKNAADFPFALLYLFDANQRCAHLVETVNLSPNTPASPERIDFDKNSLWSLVDLAQTGKAQRVDDLVSQFGSLPGGVWTESPRCALVLPLVQSGQNRKLGALVVGINPRRELDNDYQSFLELVAVQIATAVTNARNLEDERQQAEEERQRLVALIDNSMDFIGLATLDNQAVFVNPAGRHMIGLESVEAVRNTAIIDYFLPSDQIYVQEVIYPTVMRDGHWQGEFRFRHFQTGQAIPVDYSLFLIKDPHTNQAIAIANISRDIRERFVLEAERDRILKREQAAREEAERANRIKDEFLAVLSHELRTPLNPILGWANLLRKRSFNPATADKALETIERNAKLQAQLVEDLLDVSRILQGKLRLNAAQVDLGEVIKAAIETVRTAAEAKSIQIETILTFLENPVWGDASRLQQVCWNLLSNAVKFSSIGGRVEVRLEQVGTNAQITVSDTGKGIQPDFLPYVFDHFRQADSSTTRAFGGLGLGLAIVRQLVELHGGTVYAASPGEGKGAIFTVLLPLMQTSSTPENETSVKNADIKKVRILVVDDEPDSLDLIAFVLEQAGAIVETALSAKDALIAFTKFKPDVLVSDIGMPDMNGYMLIRQVRSHLLEQNRQIPAIALTAYAGEINQQLALAAGFQRHLAKPVEPGELVVTISTLVKTDGSNTLIIKMTFSQKSNI